MSRMVTREVAVLSRVAVMRMFLPDITQVRAQNAQSARVGRRSRGVENHGRGLVKYGEHVSVCPEQVGERFKAGAEAEANESVGGRSV